MEPKKVSCESHSRGDSLLGLIHSLCYYVSDSEDDDEDASDTDEPTGKDERDTSEMVDSEEEGDTVIDPGGECTIKGEGGKQREQANVLIGLFFLIVNFVERAQTTSGPVIDVSKEEGTARRGQGHHDSPGLETSGQNPPIASL